MRRWKIWGLTKDTVFQFIDNGGTLLGAALSFYVLLSAAPLLLIMVSCAGLLFGDSQVSADLTRTLAHYLGPKTAHLLVGLVDSFRNIQAGQGATALGVIVLLWSASRMFQQLQAAINQLWHVRTEFKVAKLHIVITLWKYLLAILLVLLSGAFFIAFVVLSAALGLLKGSLGDELPGTAFLWQMVSLGVTAALMAAFFAILFRYLADATVAWRDAWLGAVVTAALCAVAEYPLSYYLSHPAVTSGYGAMGSLVVLLLWVYYTAQVFLLGAQFTAVYAESAGRGVSPDATAKVVKDAPVEAKA